MFCFSFQGESLDGSISNLGPANVSRNLAGFASLKLWGPEVMGLPWPQKMHLHTIARSRLALYLVPDVQFMLLEVWCAQRVNGEKEDPLDLCS